MPIQSDINIFQEMLFGYRLSQCLYVVAKLRIADFLSDGPLSILELSNLTNVNKYALQRVLRCLSAHNVFKEIFEDYFELTPLATLLISTNKYNIFNFTILCGEEFYQSMGDLLYSVKTGEPVFDKIYGENFWQYLEKTPELALTFSAAMEKGSVNSIDALLKAYDFSIFSKIIDVGGGKGHLLVAVLDKFPEITGVVFDLPCVIDQAKEYVKKFSVESRCIFKEGDFFIDQLPRGDMMILKVILHDWNDLKALHILKACRQKLNVGGRLLIIEKVIHESNYLKNILLGDIHMLVTHGGMERTLSEYKNLLELSGFKLLNDITTQSSFSIIEAAPI